MNNERPNALALTKFSFPFVAIASIFHRITGVILFAGLVFVLAALDMAVDSEAGFEQAKALMALPVGKFITWGLLSSLIYHFFAGIKHLLLDFHIGDELYSAKIATVIALTSSAICVALAGVWLW